MKKLFYMLVCVLVVTAVAVTVFAAGSAEMTISASETAVCRGDTVSFTVAVSSVEDCRSAGIALSYDETVFEFLSGRCSVSGTVLANFSDGTGVFAYGSGTDVSGEIFTFQLKVKNDAALGDYSITGNGSTRNSGGAIPTTVNSLRINVGSYDTPPTEETEPAGKDPEPTKETEPAAKDPEPTKGTEPAAKGTEPTKGTEPPSQDAASTEGTEPVTEDTAAPTEGTQSVGEDTTASTEGTEPVADDVPPQDGFPWWSLIVGAVIAVGGAAVVLVVVRKKNID